NHDNCPAWFENLYNRDHHIEAKHNKYKRTLDKWLKSEKAKAQNQGKYYSKSDAEKCLKATKRYVSKCVKPILENEELLE
ncbi:MAG: hypothetical protein ABEJ98_04400, partial [Candidatus Nanohaloarchaea archaeon]